MIHEKNEDHKIILLCWQVHHDGQHLPIERYVDLMIKKEQGIKITILKFVHINLLFGMITL